MTWRHLLIQSRIGGFYSVLLLGAQVRWRFAALFSRVVAPDFSRGLKPIGIYTISGFPESHHRQVVDRSIPTYKTPKNPPESHHRQVVDRSIPTPVFRCRARRLDLNDPPPAGGGILGNLPSPCRLGLNDPPAPAGGIRLNIICVDTNGLKPTAKFKRRCRGRKTRAVTVSGKALKRNIQPARFLSAPLLISIPTTARVAATTSASQYHRRPPPAPAVARSGLLPSTHHASRANCAFDFALHANTPRSAA